VINLKVLGGEHRFWILVYKYSNYYQGLHKLIGFMTTRKYPSEQMTVLDQEMNNVLNLLKSTYRSKNPLER
jgi:hypothetical protein